MKIRGFTKTFDGRTVLAMPDHELAPGKVCAVIGANGSGKSTLARVLASVLQADDKSPVLPKDTRVGYMPQKSYAFRMKVRSNVLLAGQDPDRAKTLLEALGIAHLAGQRANRLSGGETAKMALARTLMRRWELLILDEPTASMDMGSTILAEGLIRSYSRETGGAVLLVTHSLQQARRIGDDALFLHEGALTESGPAAEVLFEPRKPETKAFLGFYA